jgi:hypothetical protein
MKRLLLATLPALFLVACQDAPTQASALAFDLPARPVILNTDGTTSQSVCSSAVSTQLLDPADGRWRAAVALTSPDGNYAAALPHSVWVAENTSGESPFGDRQYRTTFSLPSDAAGITMSGEVMADNHAAVSLNGTQIFEQPERFVMENFTEAHPFSATSGFTPGAANTLSFTVWNGDEPLGAAALNFCVTVTYRTATVAGDAKGRCPAAPAIAADYLKTLNILPANSRYRSIINAVSARMQKDESFNRTAKCDAGYADQVKAFVQGMLGQ